MHAANPVECIARVYRDYTTSRLLTSELIEGIPLASIVMAVDIMDAVRRSHLSLQPSVVAYLRC